MARALSALTAQYAVPHMISVSVVATREERVVVAILGENRQSKRLVPPGLPFDRAEAGALEFGCPRLGELEDLHAPDQVALIPAEQHPHVLAENVRARDEHVLRLR